jgi:release factor glutamine methyltransferase
VSPAAIECARANAAAFGATLEIELGDGIAVLDAATRDGDRRFDLLVSNPPYVRVEESTELAPEVREHEPHPALFAPAGDGDYWVREILARARAWLTPGGRVLIELGCGQAERAASLARAHGFEPRVHRDLAGIQRVLEAW